jgi:hypothetical protein
VGALSKRLSLSGGKYRDNGLNWLEKEVALAANDRLGLWSSPCLYPGKRKTAHLCGLLLLWEWPSLSGDLVKGPRRGRLKEISSWDWIT